MRIEGQCQPVKSAYDLVVLLKTCAAQKDLSKGSELHAYIRSHTFLDKNSYVASALVNMYAKCGALAQAQRVLEGLPVRDMVTWSALITGYAQQGQGEEALKCFDRMQREGHTPDAVTFTCALKACGSIGAAAKGKDIHDKIVSLGMLQKDILLGGALVDMYARCGALAKAQQVLEGLPVRNVVMWSALVAAYAQQGKGEEALKCFDNMQRDGHPPNVVTFICTLQACGRIGAVAKGRQIHNKIVNLGLLEKNIVLGSTLVDMYARCGLLEKAQKVLEGLPARNVVTWNALIAGYAQNGQWDAALICFDSMQREGHPPDAVTFTCALKACGNIGAAAKGKQIHDRIICLGMLNENVMLGSAVVDMYAKCGALVKAQQVLEKLRVRDVVTWNALIAGYVQQGQGKDALKCFEGMQYEGHSPNVVTFTCALKACGNIGAVAKGEQIHEKIVRLGMLEKNTVIGSALVDMYVRCGALTKARRVLKVLYVRDVVMWSTLITGYVQEGQGDKALKCFDCMQQEGHCPDAVTFICALKACGLIGAATKGEQIHEKVVSLGMLEKNIELGSVLMDMYAKCGALAKALQVFKGLHCQNVITWNVLIGGYALQGQGTAALNCFERMQSKGVKSDATTLICVLNACVHSGLLDQAEMLFSSMSTKYGILPNEEHYCCMVDTFGRARRFNEALNVIENMSSDGHLPVWVALLGACRTWGEVKIGRLAFEYAHHLDKSNCATYICMSDIYTAAGLQEDKKKIELLKLQRRHGKCLDAVRLMRLKKRVRTRCIYG